MIFPKWMNKIPVFAPFMLVGVIGSIGFAVWYWGGDKHLVIGYQPKQPIEYSHTKHVSELGIDCRYCHFNVEKSSKAGVPPTEVCMNCHNQIKTDSPEIQKLTQYHEQNIPVPWVKVHKLPDYAYFDHSAHVNKGVSCVECHGRVDKMEKVRQTKSLSMGFCLDCHRNPAPRVRDKSEVTRLGWKPPQDSLQYREYIMKKYHINPREDCSTCHR